MVELGQCRNGTNWSPLRLFISFLLPLSSLFFMFFISFVLSLLPLLCFLDSLYSSFRLQSPEPTDCIPFNLLLIMVLYSVLKQSDNKLLLMDTFCHFPQISVEMHDYMRQDLQPAEYRIVSLQLVMQRSFIPLGINDGALEEKQKISVFNHYFIQKNSRSF